MADTDFTWEELAESPNTLTTEASDAATGLSGSAGGPQGELLDSLSGEAAAPPPSQQDDRDWLASLFDDQPGCPAATTVVGERPVPQQAAPSPNTRMPVSEHSWENAFHLVPPHLLPLLRRYPPIGLSQHPKHGLVILIAYLEDKGRRLRRNFKLGNDMFFHASELETLEIDTEGFDCRIVVKTFRHQPGMRIRYWENTPNGDTPGRSGSFDVTARGLRRQVGGR
jgi:hypothetical protein